MFKPALITAAAAALAAALANAAVATAETPSPEEMWAIVQQQQKEIERLRGRLGETEAKVEATGDMVEAAQAEDTGAAPGWWNRTYLGGYGELHYNGGDTDEVDLHRFVMLLNHDFNDELRFVSELEVEHAFTGRAGQVEVEQAYLEYTYNPNFIPRVGMMLIPAGIINITHEPNTFFGTERNRVENDIIPTTWREAGVGAQGELGAGFAYDVSVHSGLNVPTTGNNAFRIRNGRQKVSQATAKDGAITGRIKWTGMPGVELALSGQYQNDITQNGLGIDAILITAHADIRRGPWGLRALYARWDLADGPPANGPARIGADEQYGWYIEPSYRFDVPGMGSQGELGIFARYSQRDRTAGDSVDSDIRQFDIGANYWPHHDVVLKVDGQFEFLPTGSGTGDNRLNVGLGYHF